MQSGYSLISGASSQAAPYTRRMLVRLAAAGRVQWLACGHFVDLQRLIYEVAVRCGGGYYRILKDNLVICRAETCYQVVSVLRKTSPGGRPVIISDLLRHFYGENTPPEEAQELFFEGLQALKELSRGGGVAVSACETAENRLLFDGLRRGAGRIISL